MNIASFKTWAWGIGITSIVFGQAAQAASITVGTASPLTGPATCPPPFPSPQCESRPFDTSEDAAFQGGPALPAVAFDVIDQNTYESIHRAEFANDGRYGNGSSWISNSPNSWLKIDLGKMMNLDGL